MEPLGIRVTLLVEQREFPKEHSTEVEAVRGQELCLSYPLRVSRMLDLKRFSVFSKRAHQHELA